jgi:CMP-N,N'-diacetyllegionaminic acid synthase
MPMQTVAVIPARGGSRGLPRKNLRLLGGVPLVVHTIRAALAAALVDRVIVSTDDETIARVSRQAGAEVPFTRPAHLAGDEATTFAVIRHAVDWLEESTARRVDFVVTLQPTSPLRPGGVIDEAIELVRGGAHRSAVTVAEIPFAAPTVGLLSEGRFRASVTLTDPRRQVAPSAVRLTGAVYVTSRDLLDEGRLTDGAPAAILTHGAAAIDIDSAADLAVARRAMRADSLDG